MTSTLPRANSYDPVISVRDEDAAGVISTMNSLSSSWAKGDAAAMAELYNEDACVVMPGDTYLRGRQAIREAMEIAFQGKWQGTEVVGVPLELRYVTEDAILMLTQGGAHQPGATEVSADDAIRGLWVFVRQGAGWTIAGYENTPLQASVPVPDAS